jgi:RimJ/RimL family protein N-acetyltransferase
MKDSWTHETERYRYATREDIPAFVELLSDPEVGRWLWFTPIPPAGVKAFFGPFIDRQAGELEAGNTPRTAVFTVEDLGGEFLGHGAVVAVDGSPNGFEIGFQLVRNAWGRGVGTRLGQFLCAYAIECCDAYRIEGGCLEGNTASATLLRKLGLNLEGTRPGYRLKEAVRHTELCFGVEVRHLNAEVYRNVAMRTGVRV